MTTRFTRRRFAASLLLALAPCWFTLGDAQAASVTRVTVKGASPSYTVQEVPIPGINNVNPETQRPAINESGQVTGTGFDGEEFQAFRTNAALTTITKLSGLEGSSGNQSNAINDAGLITGISVFERTNRPVKFFPNGDAEYLGEFSENGRGSGFGINNNNVVVGAAGDNDGITHAFIHTPGDDNLQRLDVDATGESEAYGINDSGTVVGQREIYRPGALEGPRGFRLQNGEVEDIGTIEGGDFSGAYAVNESGVATGYATFADNGLQHAILSQPGNPTPQDLGALPGGNNSVGYALNDSGVVVGESEFEFDFGGSTTPESHAFIYTPDGDMVDLNDLIPANSGWILESATGINNKGQIVGYGRIGEKLALFRLTPGSGGTPGQVQVSKARVQFGMIRIGQSRRRTLQLVNVGNATYAGTIQRAASPFRVVSVGGSTGEGTGGDFAFSLEPGQRVNVVIEFKPRLRARFRQRLLIANNDTSMPTLAVRMAGDACGRHGR
jgi:probable HAF family extracellular repeat protein